MSEGFMLDNDNAMLFFRTCNMFKINSHEGRIALLRKITARKKAVYLRDAEEFIQGKSVLKIKRTGDGK